MICVYVNLFVKRFDLKIQLFNTTNDFPREYVQEIIYCIWTMETLLTLNI